jgi:hypothetical protein
MPSYQGLWRARDVLERTCEAGSVAPGDRSAPIRTERDLWGADLDGREAPTEPFEMAPGLEGYAVRDESARCGQTPTATFSSAQLAGRPRTSSIPMDLVDVSVA